MDKVVLPDLGEGIADAEIVKWNVIVGQYVGLEDDLVELVTDKAVFNVPAPRAGTITAIHYQPGEKVRIGAVLAEMR
jgi:pyruvate/2-oxoglutarate dehydrogenase complex dihydrolipoamide acyltransferase (E2) component